MNREDPTRREFLQKIAKGAVYSAPLIATFAVAPDLLAQAGSLPGHHMMAPAASTPSTSSSPSEAPGPAPTDKHPPPSRKGD
jgi:hypothetical protein